MRLIIALLVPVVIGTFLQAKPKAAVKADKAPIKIDKAAYTKEWHTEWKQGEVPSWKETYPKEALAYEDRQSDGKIGTFVQADDNAADDEDDDSADENVDVLEQAQLDEIDDSALLQADDNDDSEEVDVDDEVDEDDESADEEAEPKTAVKADKAPIKIDKAAYTKEWHKEWKQGEVPSWKETYPKAALPYEDRQSDGKIGNFLQAKPKAAKKEKKGLKYDKAAYTKEWHTEWKQGDVPSWKKTYPKAALPYEDRQSDGKLSLLQAKPKAAKKEKKGLKYDKAAYTKEWHTEWKQGDVPSWKKTYPKAALPYEDRQSDGKIGN